MSNNRAKRLSGINTLAYLGIEPITAPLLIVKFNNEIPTTDDRVGNQIGALWISMNTAASSPNARIFFLTRLDGSGPSGIATWTEVQTGGTGPGVDFVTTDDGNTAVPVFGNLNVFGGLTDRGGINALNMTTYNDPAGSDNVFIALQESVFLPDTTDINNGVIGLGGTVDGNRFMHNFGAAGGVDDNTFLGLAAGNFTLTGTQLTAIGANAMTATTTSIRNVAVGTDALLSLNSAAFNTTAIGVEAGRNLQQCSSAVLIGYQAGFNINVTPVGDAGVRTIAIGTQAIGVGDLTGNENIMIGFQAGSIMTSATGCIGIGHRTQDGVTTGARNISMGNDSLGSALNTGSDNISIGHTSSASISTGSSNISIGTNALVLETTASNNIVIGISAGATQNSGTGENVLIGNSAGTALTVASQQVAVGYQALMTETAAGSPNVAVGYRALALATAIEGCVAVGGRALENANANDNVAIGLNASRALTTGNDTVSMGRNSLNAATTSARIVAIGGEGALQNLVTGNDNTAVGNLALTALATGSNNIAIGSSAGNALTLADSSNIIIGNAGVAGDNNTTRIGTAGAGAGQQNRCFIGGIRGITTGVADAIAVLIDSAHQLGTVSSSARYKDNIQNMEEESSPVMELRPVTFTYKNDEQKRLQYGLIAEEVEKVMPRLVVYDEDGLPQSVRYNDLPQILLNELKKLEKRVSHLERLYDTCKHIC